MNSEQKVRENKIRNSSFYRELWLSGSCCNDYELQIIQFPESYRCPPQIVEHANHLISNHPRMMEKEKLVSHRQVDADVSRSVRCYTTFASLREEMNFVGNDLHSLGLNPADCVVLSRTNYILEHAVSDLLKSGHNAYRLRRKNDFDSCVPGIIMAALRLANFRHDRVELRRLCHQWHLYTGVLINPNSVDAEATLVGGDFLRAWFNIAKKSSGIENQNLLHEIQTKLVDKLEFIQLMQWFLTNGWKPMADHDQSEIITEEIETWKRLHQDIMSDHDGDVTLNTYLRTLDLSSKDSAPKNDAIVCMTVHQSKGLQFNHVYLIAMAQGVFPSYRALNNGPKCMEIEEERRNYFVAITRSQKTLTLTCSKEYYGYPKEPSQFLEEMKMPLTDVPEIDKNVVLSS